MKEKTWLKEKSPRHLQRIKRGIRQAIIARQKMWRQFQVFEIIGNYRKGWNIARLAFHFGYSRNSIIRILGDFYKLKNERKTK